MKKLPENVEYRGGGWYRLPDGSTAKGRSEVLAALNGNAKNNEADTLTIERLDFARRGGLQYGGDRDVYKVAGYKKEPRYEDYWSYYDRHPIAGRIVDMPAQTTWRHSPEIVEPDVEDGTEFTKGFVEMSERLGLWSRMERVDRLSRIGQYAVLLIGATDVATVEDLVLPLERVNGPEDIAYLAHYSQRSATIESWDTDPRSERFGLPEFYRIDLSRNNTNFRAGTVLVHASRVIHVAEDVLEDDTYGRPVLRRVLNTIFNDEKVDAASAEAFWQLADKILQLNIDPEAALSTNALSEIDTKMQALYHDLRKHFYLQGGELSWLGGDSPDPSAISEVLATKMAAGSNIPKRILFGSERGELASNQDERNYFGSISERQEHHAEPHMLRVLIDRLMDINALPRPGAQGYEVQWPDLYVPTEKEVAERNKLNAETASALTPIGGDPRELVEVDDERNVWLRPSEEWEMRPEVGEIEETGVPDPDAPEGDQEGEE